MIRSEWTSPHFPTLISYPNWNLRYLWSDKTTHPSIPIWLSPNSVPTSGFGAEGDTLHSASWHHCRYSHAWTISSFLQHGDEHGIAYRTHRTKNAPMSCRLQQLGRDQLLRHPGERENGLNYFFLSLVFMVFFSCNLFWEEWNKQLFSLIPTKIIENCKLSNESVRKNFFSLILVWLKKSIFVSNPVWTF